MGTARASTHTHRMCGSHCCSLGTRRSGPGLPWEAGVLFPQPWTLTPGCSTCGAKGAAAPSPGRALPWEVWGLSALMAP